MERRRLTPTEIDAWTSPQRNSARKNPDAIVTLDDCAPSLSNPSPPAVMWGQVFGPRGEIMDVCVPIAELKKKSEALWKYEQAQQDIHDATRPQMTAEECRIAPEAWSQELRRKQSEAREKERLQVLCDPQWID